MATIVTIAAGDLITNSRADLNTNFTNLNADKIETSYLDTDTALAANSDTKIASQKAIKAYVDNQGDNLAPTGAVVPYAGSSAPTGWLLADGTAVSRSTYSALFTVVSTTYGAGNGTTTFNVPNLKGKIPVGYNASETEFDALGETGGAKTHTLTTAELAAHTHGVPGDAGAGGGNGFTSTVADGDGVSVVTTTSSGSGSAHNNLQPYIALNYIIKT